MTRTIDEYTASEYPMGRSNALTEVGGLATIPHGIGPFAFDNGAILRRRVLCLPGCRLALRSLSNDLLLLAWFVRLGHLRSVCESSV